MLKKLLLPVCLLALCGASFGQSTLMGSNFNPVIGDAFALKICDTTGITPGASGASITWNFATGANALTVTKLDTGRAVACTSTPYYSSFPTSTIALKGPSATADATSYLVANSTKLSQDGYYAAPDTNLILSDPADQLRYPFTYLTTFSDTYAGILTFGMVSAHHTGTVTVTCDGWGTLQLPGRTDANVLRVKTTQTFTDSTNIVGTPIMKTYSIVSYDWYKPDYHSALLTIQTMTELGSPTPTVLKFVAFASAQISAVNDVSDVMNEVAIYPVPATGGFNVKFSPAAAGRVRISLNDVTGREVALIADKQFSGTQDLHYDAANIAPGIYFVRLQSAGATVTKKVIIQ